MGTADILATELRQLVDSRGVSVQAVGVGSEDGRSILIVYVRNNPGDERIPKNFHGMAVKVVRVGVIRPAHSAYW